MQDHSDEIEGLLIQNEWNASVAKLEDFQGLLSKRTTPQEAPSGSLFRQ